MPLEKIVVGLTGLGRILELQSASNDSPGALITNNILRGPNYGIASGVTYSEVCILRERSQMHFDDTQKCPYLVDKLTWVGYENQKSIQEKSYSDAGTMNSDLFHILMIAVMSTVDGQPGQDLVRMCQYNSAARSRTTNARFNINQIDFTLCTHYVFAYANVDVVGKTIRAAEPADEGVTGQYRSFTSNKFVYLQIKMILSVGGPSPDNQAAFNAIVREESNIQTFAENAVQFVRQQRFDGLEIDWQSANDSGRLVTLLKTLKNAFIQESSVSGRIPLLLTVKCPGLITYAEEGFASKLISWYVDYVLLATYDLVVPGTAYASFSSPLYGMRGVQPDISVNSTVRFYEQVGIPFKKMLLGIRAAGRYAKLSSTLEDTPGSRITKQVVRGSMYNLPSTLAYPEVCQMRKYGQVTFDDHQKVPYLVYSDYWVGYEDRDSIRYKMRWLGSLGIVGIMFPALDEDDFSGTVGTV
ncbi:hypothetical protein BsWGS_24742 [Bradybaena similaris]